MVHKARGVFEQVSVDIPLSFEREEWWGPHRKEETAHYHADAQVQTLEQLKWLCIGARLHLHVLECFSTLLIK